MIPDRLLYFLEHFWNDQKCAQIWIPGPRIYHQKCFNEYKKIVGASLNNIIVSYQRIWKSEIVGRCVYLSFQFSYFLISYALKIWNFEILLTWYQDLLQNIKGHFRNVEMLIIWESECCDPLRAQTTNSNF